MITTDVLVWIEMRSFTLWFQTRQMDQPAYCSDPIDCYNSQTISYRDALISLSFSGLKAGRAGSRFPSHLPFYQKNQ